MLPVGGPDNHAVLRGVVLVLVLDDKTLAGVVVGLALSAPAELNLEALVVRLVLHQFDKSLEHKETFSEWDFKSSNIQKIDNNKARTSMPQCLRQSKGVVV